MVELGLWVVELDRNFQQSIWPSLGKISINLVRILSNYSNILPVNNPLPQKTCLNFLQSILHPCYFSTIELDSHLIFRCDSFYVFSWAISLRFSFFCKQLCIINTLLLFFRLAIQFPFYLKSIKWQLRKWDLIASYFLTTFIICHLLLTLRYMLYIIIL